MPDQHERALLRRLADARRHRRLERIDLFEALYRAYLWALVAAIVVVEGSGLTGDAAVRGSDLGGIERAGPAVVGGVIALAVAVGVRSGTRGGPLALERADVRHVLLAPISRRISLARPVRRLFARAALAGAAAGAVAGVLAWRRLPGPFLGWALAGVAVGALAAVGAVGSAFVVSGWRLPKPLAYLGVLVVLGWSAADIVGRRATSPASLLGGIALWPLGGRSVAPTDLLGVLVVLVLAGAGYRAAPRLSVEAAERRSRLIGGLRVAATVRDVRSVTLLRRQLADEQLRARPWIRVGSPRARRGPTRAIWVRSWQGVARWPLARLARLAVLGVIAGLAMRAAFAGTTPLVVVAALALWVAALDALEGLSGEVDHPERRRLLPRPEGWLLSRHLLAPLAIMLVVGGIGVGVASAFGRPLDALELGGVALLPAASTAVAGGAVSILREPKVADPDAAFLPPEMAGATLVLRELLPPAIALAGLTPVLFAHRAIERGSSGLQSALVVGSFLLVVPLAVLGWVQAKGRTDVEPAPAGRSGTAESRPGRPAARPAGPGPGRPASRPSAGRPAGGAGVTSERGGRPPRGPMPPGDRPPSSRRSPTPAPSTAARGGPSPAARSGRAAGRRAPADRPTTAGGPSGGLDHPETSSPASPGRRARPAAGRGRAGTSGQRPGEAERPTGERERRPAAERPEREEGR